MRNQKTRGPTKQGRKNQKNCNGVVCKAILVLTIECSPNDITFIGQHVSHGGSGTQRA